jgi:hypothetical protein
MLYPVGGLWQFLLCQDVDMSQWRFENRVGNVVYFLELEKREQSKFKMSEVRVSCMYFKATLPKQMMENFRIRKWYVFSIEYLRE